MGKPKKKDYIISFETKEIPDKGLYCINDQYYHVYEDKRFMISEHTNDMYNYKSDQDSNTLVFLEKMEDKIKEYHMINI